MSPPPQGCKGWHYGMSGSMGVYSFLPYFGSTPKMPIRATPASIYNNTSLIFFKTAGLPELLRTT